MLQRSGAVPKPIIDWSNSNYSCADHIRRMLVPRVIQWRWVLVIMFFTLDIFLLLIWMRGGMSSSNSISTSSSPANLLEPAATSLPHPLPRISICYFASVNEAHVQWQTLIRSQLQELNDFGLTPHAHVYVSLASLNKSLLTNATALVHTVIPQAHVQTIQGNLYEYPGIMQMWEVAHLAPQRNHLVLYFHSKGMWNNEEGKVRSSANVVLTDNVIKPWRTIVDAFDSDPQLNKVGYIAAPLGWIWYNFYWVRASYVYELEKPIHPHATDFAGRYYYEEWLSLKADGTRAESSDSLSMCSGNFFGRKGFTRRPEDIKSYSIYNTFCPFV